MDMPPTRIAATRIVSAETGRRGRDLRTPSRARRYHLATFFRDRALRRLDTALQRALGAVRQRRSYNDSFAEAGPPSPGELAPASPLVDVTFDALTVALPGGRVALRDATGALRAGRVAAIVGPSGAGKSTLLDLLAGRLPPAGSVVSGVVALNGLPTRRCHPSLVGFVPQDDAALLGWLTVRELVRFYAAIRERRERVDPRADAAERRERRVAVVLRELGLHGERDVLVGVAGDARRRGLSGGQRKRVAVAVELVADPSALLLDEPTSGLDAATSLSLLTSLAAAAGRGVCVAAVLHQPSAKAWHLTDDAIVFGRDGVVAHAGPSGKSGLLQEETDATKTVFVSSSSVLLSSATKLIRDGLRLFEVGPRLQNESETVSSRSVASGTRARRRPRRPRSRPRGPTC